MSLKSYRRKRDFSKTSEPDGRQQSAAKGKQKKSTRSAAKARRFVIQKHDATRLHYDFRLELNGVLISWAVPKGMPMKKGDKRLAIKVEDHPVSYIDFEGNIPAGEYGGGTVQVWDTGTFEPLSHAPLKELQTGKLHVMLQGAKLQGEWYLVKLKGQDGEPWLMIRGGDDHPKLAKAQQDESALTGRTMKQIEQGGEFSPKVKRGKSPAIKAKTTGKKAAIKSASPTAVKEEATPHYEVPDSAFIEPMKAITLDQPPDGDWSYEVKFDGFRALAYKHGTAVSLMSRTRHDMTERFPELAAALAKLKVKNAIIDGEIVALDAEGRSSFQHLQAYELGQEKPPLCYYAFDLLSLNGKSYRQQPLEKRKEKLHTLLPGTATPLRFSASLGGNAELLMDKICELGLEGLIGKRVGSLYEPGQRSGKWVKLKIVQQQEFVIGGYTNPGGSRQHFGALLVGVYENGKLIFTGKVGTGFNTDTLKELHTRFKKLSVKTCPFSNLPEERTGRYGQNITASVMKSSCHWIKPQLVCQIKFAEWTRDNSLRQPVYLGLRKDKKPADVVREGTLPAKAAGSRKKSQRIAKK